LLPDTFPYLKIYQNDLAATALPWTPLGKLTALLRPPSWTWWPLFGGRGREDKKREGTEGKWRLLKDIRRRLAPKRADWFALPKCSCPQASLASYMPG